MSTIDTMARILMKVGELEAKLDFKDETIAALRVQLTRLTADHATATKQLGEWKEMALRLDAKVIDEQRDHVKTCGYHDEAKARATKAEAALAEALERVLRLETCIGKLLFNGEEMAAMFDPGPIPAPEPTQSDWNVACWNAATDAAEALLRAARLSPAPDAKGKATSGS